MTTQGIVGLVAQHGGAQQQAHRQRVAHQSDPAHGTDHKQQGVARQERHDNHPGLHKDHQKQQRIDPQAVIAHKGFQVTVHVQDKVQEKGHKFHGDNYPFCWVPEPLVSASVGLWGPCGAARIRSRLRAMVVLEGLRPVRERV